MNKQELIDNIEKLPYLGLNYNSQENVLFQQRKKILEVIKQLDVQAKETVPKFVADWIKQCKENAALMGKSLSLKIFKIGLQTTKMMN